MKCFPVTLFLMVVAEAAVLSGVNYFTDGLEVEENLIFSKRKGYTEHDHRTDSSYAGILSNEDELDELRHLEPNEIKLRMLTIITNMDTNKSNFIEQNELTAKLLETYRKLSIEESDSEFKNSDLDENGFITWKEYVGDVYASSDDLEEDVANEEKEIFLAADINKDGHLSEIEFRYFYTPEDYSHMQPIVAHGIMNRFDTDKNGQISFQEFIGDRKKMEYDSEWFQEENLKFTQELDINNDGVLNLEEVYNWAAPNNKMLAEKEADSLISKADDNKDGKLTYDEILDHYTMFISPESDGYYIFRDEL